MRAYKEWEERWKRELKFLFSKEGEELQRCLVAQGYSDILFGRLMVCFGSGFAAINIIKQLEQKIK
ncbi:hypothetical protein LCGC14_0509690 [marine sediment metagenome]|uniref:Uncharacterized protein n=1 Tax=marine sediment metagenome TaxID=412755 RepID=A0A0F9VA39_9ZZZZ|nr:hypothetical protein [bacterium]